VQEQGRLKSAGKPLEQDRFGWNHLQSQRRGRSVNPALLMDLRARFTFRDPSPVLRQVLRSETILL
jgi:hypothetical protein